MRPLRVIVFSDSLGLPRCHLPTDERTEFEDVYSYQLREKLQGVSEVEICYIISLDTERAVSLAQYKIAFRRPDIVILHLGVNDCAPRVFKKDSCNIIFRPWFPLKLKRLILSFVRRYRRFLTKYIFRNRVYVSPQNFQDNLRKIQEIVQEYSPYCHFLAMSILPTTSQLNQRSYDFNANVARYNAIMQEVFGDNYVDLDNLLGENSETYLISDGIHLTSQAHTKVANHLYPRIMQLLENNKVLS